ncbi:serine hydrolase domain-containing protein [Hoeflea poritis]|uniref:Serine hydrolase n=1 Tax=Hoeflea poritis TaxID=2993659 RepID=A0ABT4VQQ4_9HYPH|nr:serine hydrolase [Hoeflea poritis]MDA4846939.1 serine hydrolase [Hoeflea poritis]
MRKYLADLFAVGALFLAALSSTGTAADTELDRKLKQAHAAGELVGLHGVLIVHKGDVIAEAYFDGNDERWGTPLPDVEHGAATLHDLRSVTKSVVGLLYGIALDEGIVPPVDAPLIAQFPQYADLAGDPQRDRILVQHALSMRMGTEWNEDLPYTDPRNSEIAMENAPDRYRFVLDRPMVADPGEEWRYNGGATAIIAKLIADGAGMPIDQYARQKLFEPLGIENFEWVRGRGGVPSAASGLRLALPDLVKIGQLILDDGVYNGTRVVSREWLRESFKPRAELNQLRYGYQWWLASWGDPPSWVAGFGNGGQRLTVQPEHDLIVAVFAGNYNRPDAWKLPVRIIEEFMVPAVRARTNK